MQSNKLVSQEEVRKYQEYYAEKHGVEPDDIEILTLNFTVDGNVEVEYNNKSEYKFERIARITGYLVGTLDRWNGAKQAECRERVKHA